MQCFWMLQQLKIAAGRLMTFHPRLSIIICSLPAGSALQNRPVRNPGEIYEAIKLEFSCAVLCVAARTTA